MDDKNTHIPDKYIMLEAANALAASGFSVIPIKYDKRPNIPAWKPYQELAPNAFQINEMFVAGIYGIAIITGKVSGNLEILDEDLKYDRTGTMHDDFIERLNEQAPGLIDKLVIQKTRSGGHHYLYYCQNLEGNLKLASRPANDAEKEKQPQEREKVLYETRGEGGYIVCSPTPGYTIIQGSLKAIPTITPAERDILLSVARSFNQCFKEHAPINPRISNSFTGLSPFEDYNQRGDIIALLEKHGWTVAYTKGAKTFLKRPGDTKTTQSANFDQDKNWFTCFSTSTEFKTQTAYKPYAVYATLECNCDYSTASKQLYEAGYGDRKSISNQNQAKSNFNNLTNISDLELSKFVINSIDLLKNDQEEPRYLLSPIIPRIGTGVLAGMPDTGKSQFARQICIAIATGMNHFLDYALTTTHNRALYIATEDDDHNTSYLLRKQLEGLGQNASEKLTFVFADLLSQDEIIAVMDKHLTENPCDLVVVDSYGDVFAGSDSNNSTAMRQTVKNFDRIAKKHQCLILFVHHTTKSSYKQAPHQMHIMGGAGLVQKARLALQLTQDESGIKYLTIVKGNYCPQDLKQHAMELTFDKNHFIFTRTGKNVPRESLNQEILKDKDTKLDKLVQLADEIFQHESISHKTFCERHSSQTGKGIAQANRDLKSMKELEIIIKAENEKLWKLNGSITPVENPDIPEDPIPF